MGRLRIKRKRKRVRYPAATIAFYGPTDEFASKVAVGIVLGPEQDPDDLRRWFSDTNDVRNDPAIGEQIAAFLKEWGVKTSVMTDGIIGCPHEEGTDYPEGGVCPQCPFWANRDRWTGELLDSDEGAS
jgi:hypothetical protein